MGRIPRVLAEINTPAPPGARIDPRAVPDPGRGIAQVAGAVSNAVSAFADLNDRMQETGRVAEFSSRVSQAVEAADELDQDLQTSPDPASNVERWRDGFGKIRTQALQGVTDQRLAQQLTSQLTRLEIGRGSQARRTAHKLTVDRALADVETSLASFRTQALRARSPEDVAAIRQAGELAITGLEETGAVTAVVAQQRRQRFRQDLADAGVEKEIALDPFGAALKLHPESPDATYANMDPTKRMQQFTQALSRYDGLMREKRTRDAELTKAGRDALSGEIRNEMYSGEDMEDRIKLFARQLGDEHHTSLLSLNRTLREARERDAKAADRKSDGPTLVALNRDILTGAVRDFAAIQRAIDHDKVTPADGIELFKLVKAETERRRNEGESDRDKLKMRGLDIIRRRLKTVGVMNFDAVSEQQIADAELDYLKTVDARDANGNARNPLDYASDVSTVYERGLQAADRPEAIRLTIPQQFRSKEDVRAAWKRGELSDDEAARYVRLFLRLEALPATPTKKPTRTPTTGGTR